MTIDVGVSSAHKDVSAVSVGVSSAWKTCTGAWVGVSGAWKKFFPGYTATLPASMTGEGAAADPAAADVSLVVGNTGGWSITGSPTNLQSASGQWNDDLANDESLFEARLTNVSGTTSSGTTTGTWHNLGTTRTWILGQSGEGSTSYQGTLEIREAASGSVLATSTVYMTATVEGTPP